MQVFIDSADSKEIRKWLDQGVIDGVTTNPSILLKDGGYDMAERVREVAALVDPMPVSAEVTTNDVEQIVHQAEAIASWAGNIVVKVPVINEFGQPCLSAVKELTTKGIKVNMTACLSFGQVILGAKAGATYISIFGGRVADEGGDAPALIRESVTWLRNWGYSSRIIVGSIRGVIDIQQAAIAGAHVITIPPQFLEKMVDHKFTRDTVRGFISDARKALEAAARTNIPSKAGTAKV
ncbi:MAG: transaldolase [Chloroflexi bacterium]|nr:transaldolase [Chloroflexota bacterium]